MFRESLLTSLGDRAGAHKFPQSPIVGLLWPGQFEILGNTPPKHIKTIIYQKTQQCKFFLAQNFSLVFTSEHYLSY